MLSRRHLATVILAVLTVFAAGAAWSAVRTTVELRAERRQALVRQAGLSQELADRQRADELAAAEKRRRLEQGQAGLARLHAQLAMMETADIARCQHPEPDLPWRNAGTGTPMAAVETLMWSAARGELAELQRVTALDADAQAKAQRLFADVPPSLQAEFGDAGTLVAAVMAVWLPWHSSMPEVVAEEAVTADECVLHLRWPRNNRAARDLALRCRRGPGGWRLLVPAPVIMGYRCVLLGTAAPEVAAVGGGN